MTDDALSEGRPGTRVRALSARHDGFNLQVTTGAGADRRAGRRRDGRWSPRRTAWFVVGVCGAFWALAAWAAWPKGAP